MGGRAAAEPAPVAIWPRPTTYGSPPLPAGADWWAVERHVLRTLEGRDVGRWARSLAEGHIAADDPATGLLLRLSVFARAGHAARLEWTVRALAALGEPPPADSLAAAADFLIERHAWEPVRALFEAFPEIEPGWASSFIEQWGAWGDPAAIDRWLAVRARRSDVWFQERLRYRIGRGTAGDLFVELSDAIRAEPWTRDGWRSARRLGEALRALVHARPERFAPGAPRLDDAWLVEVASRMDAFPCYLLAETLLEPWPEAAAALFEVALEAPFGHADERAVARRELCRHSAMRPARDLDRACLREERLRDWARLGLARARRTLGARHIIANFFDAEASCLVGQRPAEILLRELGDIDPRSVHAGRVLYELFETATAEDMRAGDERLWRLLAAREWGTTERSLLELLLDVAGEAREKVWHRAESLAEGDVSRALELGRVYARAGNGVDAARQLAAAVLGMSPGRRRAAAAHELFRARLDLGEWAAAEAVWPIARNHLDASEAPLEFGALSLAAARGGDPVAALRLWARRANLDRGDLRGVVELSEIIGPGPLVRLYAAIAREDPLSVAPRQAIERIRSGS